MHLGFSPPWRRGEGWEGGMGHDHYQIHNPWSTSPGSPNDHWLSSRSGYLRSIEDFMSQSDHWLLNFVSLCLPLHRHQHKNKQTNKKKRDTLMCTRAHPLTITHTHHLSAQRSGFKVKWFTGHCTGPRGQTLPDSH